MGPARIWPRLENILHAPARRRSVAVCGAGEFREETLAMSAQHLTCHRIRAAEFATVQALEHKEIDRRHMDSPDMRHACASRRDLLSTVSYPGILFCYSLLRLAHCQDLLGPQHFRGVTAD
jgi:hypothetical protein